MAESNTKGGHSIRNTGSPDQGNKQTDARSGTNSGRVPGGTSGPTAASGGKGSASNPD